MHHLTMNIQDWMGHHTLLAWWLLLSVFFMDIVWKVILRIMLVINKKDVCGVLALGVKDVSDKPVTCIEIKGHEGPHKSYQHGFIKW